MRGGKPPWTQTDELLATVAEVVDVGNRILYAAHARKGSKMPPPIEIPRPWEKKRKMATPQQLKAFLEATRS